MPTASKLSCRGPFQAIFVLAVMASALFTNVAASRILTSALLDLKDLDNVMETLDGSSEHHSGSVQETNASEENAEESMKQTLLSEALPHTLPDHVDMHGQSKQNGTMSRSGKAEDLETVNTSSRPSTSTELSPYSLMQSMADAAVAALPKSRLKHQSKILIGVSIGLLMLCCCTLCLPQMGSKKPHSRQQHYYRGKLIYEWDQTSTTANIYMKPPPGMKKSDFEITIQADKIRIGRKGKAAFLSEKYYHEVEAEHSSWDFRNAELQIYLTKAIPADWPYVLEQKDSDMEGKTSKKGLDPLSRLLPPLQGSSSVKSSMSFTHDNSDEPEA